MANKKIIWRRRQIYTRLSSTNVMVIFWNLMHTKWHCLCCRCCWVFIKPAWFIGRYVCFVCARWKSGVCVCVLRWKCARRWCHNKFELSMLPDTIFTIHAEKCELAALCRFKKRSKCRKYLQLSIWCHPDVHCFCHCWCILFGSCVCMQSRIWQEFDCVWHYFFCYSNMQMQNAFTNFFSYVYRCHFIAMPKIYAAKDPTKLNIFFNVWINTLTLFCALRICVRDV